MYSFSDHEVRPENIEYLAGLFDPSWNTITLFMPHDTCPVFNGG